MEKSECHRQKIISFNESGRSESRETQEKEITFTRCDFNAKYLERIDNPDYVCFSWWRISVEVRQLSRSLHQWKQSSHPIVTQYFIISSRCWSIDSEAFNCINHRARTHLDRSIGCNALSFISPRSEPNCSNHSSNASHFKLQFLVLPMSTAPNTSCDFHHEIVRRTTKQAKEMSQTIKVGSWWWSDSNWIGKQEENFPRDVSVESATSRENNRSLIQQTIALEVLPMISTMKEKNRFASKTE